MTSSVGGVTAQNQEVESRIGTLRKSDVEAAPPPPCAPATKRYDNPLYVADDDLDDYSRIALVSDDTNQSQHDSRPTSLEVTTCLATPDNTKQQQQQHLYPLSPTGYPQPPTPDFPPPSPATAEAGIEKKIAPILEFVSDTHM